jgi:hypothetical protein
MMAINIGKFKSRKNLHLIGDLVARAKKGEEITPEMLGDGFTDDEKHAILTAFTANKDKLRR